MALGILSRFRNGAGLGQKSLSEQGAISPLTLRTSDFFTADTAVVVNTEQILGEYTILPQTRHAFGFGTPEFSDNQGTIYCNIEDTAAAELDGEVILSVQDYNGNNNRVVYRGLLSDLRSGLSDITKRVKFPLTGVFGSENDKLVLKFKPSSVGNGTVDKDTTEIYIASSVQYLGTV